MRDVKIGKLKKKEKKLFKIQNQNKVNRYSTLNHEVTHIRKVFIAYLYKTHKHFKSSLKKKKHSYTLLNVM
jgi:hypothetical protein